MAVVGSHVDLGRHSLEVIPGYIAAFGQRVNVLTRFRITDGSHGPVKVCSEDAHEKAAVDARVPPWPAELRACTSRDLGEAQLSGILSRCLP